MASYGPVYPGHSYVPATIVPYTNWFVLVFALVVSALIGIAIVKYLDGKHTTVKWNKHLVKSVITLSMSLEIIAALYLLIADHNLIKYAQLHWLALLVFTAVNVILLEMYLLSIKRDAYDLIAGWSIMGVVAMLLDAFLALPLSQFAGKIGSSIGVTYLFGFGVAGTGSTFGMSLAFVVLLASAFIAFARSLFYIFYKKRK